MARPLKKSGPLEKSVPLEMSVSTRSVRAERRSATRRRCEKGAVLPLAAVGIVLAVVASALSIDLGRVAQERRQNQKVADLAALDAARDLTVAQARALTSAGRNQFVSTAPGNLQALVGFLGTDGIFTPDAGGDTVRVIARSVLDNALLAGSHNVAATAYARAKKEAGFTIGSSLASASLDAVNIPVLSRVVERLIGAPSGTISLVSYNGLAAANVKLGRLATQLGFATVDELLEADLTVRQILTGAATVLANDGILGAVELNQIAAAAGATTLISIGDFVTVAQGSEATAARTSINALGLIGATGSVANKNNFLSIPNAFATLPVPGGGSVGTSLGLKVIEGPRTYIGPEGGFVETSQVELSLTTTADNVNVSIVGLPLLQLTGIIPVTATGAGARGTLTRVTCAGANRGLGMRVDPKAVSASVSAPNLVLKGPLGITVATVTGVGLTPTTTGASSTLNFAYPEEFTPTAVSKSTPSSAPGLAGLTSVQTGSVTIGGLSLPLAPVVNSIFNALDPVMNAAEQRMLMPALRALGLSVGPADVGALLDAFDPAACGLPMLVK